MAGIEPRLVETERALVAARWLMLTAVLLLSQLAPLAAGSQPWVYLLLAAGAVYNLVYMALLRRRAMPQFVTEITVSLETVFCGALIWASGGRESVYIALLAWPVIGAAFRLGLPEALAAATLGSLLVFYFFLWIDSGLDLAQLQPALTAIIYLYAGAGLASFLFQQAHGLAQGGLAREQAAAKELTAKLASVRDQAQAIAGISSVLSATLNYQRVLETTLSEFHKLVPYDVGFVYLFDYGSGELHVATDHGINPLERTIRISSSAGAVGKAIQSGEPLILADPSNDEELHRYTSLASLSSALCVPLHAGMEMYGAVLIASRAREAFTPTHLDLLLAFCNQAVLAMHNAQLSESLRKERDRIVESDEDARRRLARDLHDGPVQLVAAMAMKAEVIRRMGGATPAEQTEEVAALADMAHRASRDLRTVLFELRPVMLESHGLVATLKEYVQKMRDSQNAPLRLDAGGFSRRLPLKTESTIFGIVQEAVNNALKHAEARTVWIRLAERDHSLSVVVEDDGLGFDVASVEGSYSRRGSLGLLNMRERAELVDGMVGIRSALGTGTTVTLRVPLADASAVAARDEEVAGDGGRSR